MQNKKKMIIAGGIVALVGIIIAILAVNGVFDKKADNESCPEGKIKVCSISPSTGEETCTCELDELEKKPIIYLYPEEETELTVRLGNPEKITSSYPKYTDGWDVIAYPNGDLIDKATGKKLYSLYWEGQKENTTDQTTGFVVKGEETAKFLEEKLEYLGLNYREKEEFIVYWLPILEANNYNYIYFETAEEIDAEMPLEFSVKPDTVIRVRMAFKGLDEYKNVVEQKLQPAPERNGFTVVEWGGTELTK